MRSYVERARAAFPAVTDERKLVEIACNAYNNNVSRSTNQKPIYAALHPQEIRDFTDARQASNIDKKRKKYISADMELQMGDRVHRRIRKMFGKESSLANVSKDIYTIVKVIRTWPLPSYKLEDIRQGIVLPGSYQANVLIKTK
jgi:hypothetical protein